MDRRTLLALTLTAIVIVATPLLFPAPKRPIPDSLAAAAAAESAATRAAQTPAAATKAPVATPTPRASASRTATPNRPTPPATVAVTTSRATYTISSPGGTPSSVTLSEYRSLRPDPSKGQPVEMVEQGDRLFRFWFHDATDSISLDTVAFRFEPQRREGNTIVQSLTSTTLAKPISLTYRFQPDSFVVGVDVAGLPSKGVLFVWLPATLHSEEADVRDDGRHLAISYRPGNADAKGTAFAKLDTMPAADSGAIRWVAERNKYFVVAALPAGRDTAFHALFTKGEPKVNGEAVIARVIARLPVTGSTASIRVFAGPQLWTHLRATAPELENVNPYGGWLHGVVQPFATIVMRLLLWIRATTHLGYGWVLVLFGVVIRLLMWPLNQNAMRSTMRMQRIQPQLTAIQTKYAGEPDKQREAMLKLYQDNGMSPFSPVLGCLPMFLPMPILFALYFVFQNTIELRGVAFLWLPDLSLRDPYFITPLFMGASMFLLSWIGMRGMPPSPQQTQSQIMSYMMPVMFTALFWNFASGLNLYYAVQNVAALPQQWLLARERQTSNAGNAGSTASKPGSAKGAPGG